MRYEVQVHYENGGSLSFFKEFPDEEDRDNFTCYVSDHTGEHPDDPRVQFECDETKRIIVVDLKTVTAVIMTPQKNQPDLFERAYAVKEIEE